MSDRLVIALTVPDEDVAEYVKHVGDLIDQGFTSGQVPGGGWWQIEEDDA